MFRRQKRKNLDFKQVEKQIEKQDVVRRYGRYMMMMLPILLSVLYLQNYLYGMNQRREMEKEILEIQEFLNNQDILEEKARLDNLERELELLTRFETEYDSLRELSKERTALNSRVLLALESAMEGQVEMVEDENYPLYYEDGILKFTAQTSVPEEASGYVERLERTGVFTAVEYSGFERRGVTEDGAEVHYLFDVECRLALPEERGDQSEKTVKT